MLTLPAEISFGSAFVIYRWWCGGKYLAYELAPKATIIDASIYDTVEQVHASLPSGVRTFLFHLNITLTARFPKGREELVGRLKSLAVRILNENVTDISKNGIQKTCQEIGLPSTLAQHDGDEDELVIIKTDSNVACDSEYQLTAEDRSVLGLGEPVAFIRYSSDYKVLPRKDVPSDWWSDSSLICERFITNSAERWYRAYKFLSRIVLCEFTSTDVIKKVSNSVVRRLWFVEIISNGWNVQEGDGSADPVLEQLVRFAAEVQLDFGTIDVMVDNAGVPYIIDLNSTPAYNHPIAGLIPYMQSVFHD
ncbi:hypothetical protein ACFL6U_02345 [Planctomycetota bacterium]